MQAVFLHRHCGGISGDAERLHKDAQAVLSPKMSSSKKDLYIHVFCQVFSQAS